MTSDVASPVGSEMHLPVETKRGRWWAWLFRLRVVIPLFILLVLLLAPTLIRGYRLSSVPEATEPFDTESVLKVVVPDDQNAFVEYRQAADLLVALSSTATIDLDEVQKGEWDAAPEVVRRWVDDNRRVLELWKLGSAKADAQYIRAGEANWDTLMPVIEQLRTVARLVALDAMRLRAEGHPDQAWDLLCSGMQTGNHVGRRGIVIERLVGMSISVTMGQEIVKWARNPAVSVALLERARVELDDIWRQRPLTSSTLQHEYFYVRLSMHSESMLNYIGKVRPSPLGLNNLAFYTTGEPSLSDRSLKHVFRNYLTQADKPARDRTKQTGVLKCFEPHPSAGAPAPTPSQLDSWVLQSILCYSALPAASQFISAADRAEVRNSLVTTVLALEIYRRQHGTYPDTLSALVPDIMPEIADDLYEPSPTPLKYRREDTNAVLWSVSDDTVDNAGDIVGGKDLGYRLEPPKPRVEAGAIEDSSKPSK